jgi:hypothetical protein
VSLNFVAIPYTQTHFDNGAIGAALVTSLTEVFLLVVGQILLERGILDTHTYVAAAKCLVVGIAMGGLVWWANDLPLLITVPLGAVVYGVGVLLFGVVSPSELSEIRSLLSRRRAVPRGEPAPVVTGYE